MTARPFPLDKPKNIVSFLKNGTACVVFFPYARELTEYEKKRIGSARAIRFFVDGSSAISGPSEATGFGTIEAYPIETYPIESLRWAISKATYMCTQILDCRQLREIPSALVNALLELDAKMGNDDHRCVVSAVVARPFVGDDLAVYRPVSASQEAGR
jgi:hypothetical protein